MDISGTLGIDLGKNVCSLGAATKRPARSLCALCETGDTDCSGGEASSVRVVGMEACCGAHHLGRVLAAHGHDVRLTSPEYVRPYIKAQKNDDRDVEGIVKAATRPTMRFVERKSQDQLDMQMFYRSRQLAGRGADSSDQSVARHSARARTAAPQGKRKLELFLSRADG